MPSVILFMPCAMPIIDAVTNNLSLMSVIEAIQPVGIEPSDQDLPAELREARFFLPPFSIVTVWRRKDTEENQKFEQYVTLIAPDGRETPVTPIMNFTFTARNHRVLLQTNLTFGRLSGETHLSLKLRPSGQEEWETFADYTLIVEEVPTSQPQPSTSQPEPSNVES